ncbi:Polypeptide N-acetylgalactosaminyltransferase 2 [Schistosoma haematobium]|uniref:Polypeptide N-acetylgalactosaminyltransferase 2 n=1 Tax=Schistosoma haematobium TaxID=6185 RepID=A0A922ILK6_SCHHA|nr:Polypeptide N-acetylgalactosaminyltransferase 2 [Schistosoma haematobium]KAH9582575.1 Polypeptide N-acetylgalactosaminyltransferase 2 [Schistosoma haematobium]
MYPNLIQSNVVINKIIIIIITFYLLLFTRSTLLLNSLHFNQNHFRKTQKFNIELCHNLTLNTLAHHLNIELLSIKEIYKYIPKISIIIIAYNENSIIIKNTLQSILMNTSLLLFNNNIKEIILIDDYSNPPIDDDQIRTLSKIIRVIRNENRVGLIKSRMNGARNATGEILVFLDAHVETLEYWLEPLVVQLISLRKQHQQEKHGQLNLPSQQDEKRTSKLPYDVRHFIVSPLILSTLDKSNYDNIEDNLYLGGFTWDLIFRWHHIHENVTPLSIKFNKTDVYHLIYPIKTPALAGGLFAVWKDDFFNYGGYDEEMNIWGGENIELSLRTWMCHGQIEIIPCSRVGHIFHNEHPYTFPMGKEFTILRNHKRTVLVWFQHDTNLTLAREYLSYYYTVSPMSKIIPAGDLKLRRTIPNSLNCHTFTWYLENIYPLLKQEAKNIEINDDTYYLTAFDSL